MIKVSVVIPVYKAEKYLLRCVNSVLNQTLSDIEIILVDDGSSDDSPKICDELKRAHDQIIVIHKSNGGVSSARNAGIKAASGDYIGFIDSDDDALPSMYETLYQAALDYDADMVMIDYVRIKANGIRQNRTTALKGGVYQKRRIIQDIYPSLIMGKNIDYGPLVSVWQILFKADFLHKHKLLFDEDIKWSEDNMFNAIAGYYCNRFVYLKENYLYQYRENKNSITTSYKKGAWEVYCTMNKRLCDFFKDKTDIEWRNQIKLHIIYYAFVCLNQESRISSSLTDEYIRIVKSDTLKDALNEVKVSDVSLKMKVKLWLLKKQCLWVYYL